MSFINEKFVPSGTYFIVNAKYDRSIISHRDADDDSRLMSSSVHDFKWEVVQLSSRKWTIQNPSNGVSIDLAPESEEGDELLAQHGQNRLHQWAIKHCSSGNGLYIIYSPGETGLFWALQNGNDGTALELSSDQSDGSSRWKFSKTTEDTNTHEVHPTPLAVDRPTPHDPNANRVAITIPPKWLTTISAVSIGQCISLVRIKLMTQGALDMQSFVGSWDSIEQAMVLDGLGTNSHAIQAKDESVVVVLEFFHSTNTRRRDPLALPGKGDVSKSLRVVSVARPTDMRSFPDYQTIYVFDERTIEDHPNSPVKNVIVTIQSNQKVLVDLINPSKPVSGTVNNGYDENLDRPRPGSLDQYLENYDIIFVVDDSGSMSGGRWKQVREALALIGNEAMQYDTDGVDMCFLNSVVHKESIKTQRDILDIFEQVQPGGFTPTGAKLQEILKKLIDNLDNAIDTPAYRTIKPVEIVVITDGVPTDDPSAVIQASASQLDEGMHHPNAIGIQFVQIGNDEGAEEALQQLCKGSVRGMVDTVPYVPKFTPERLKRVLLGGLHPSIRSQLHN